MVDVMDQRLRHVIGKLDIESVVPDSRSVYDRCIDSLSTDSELAGQASLVVTAADTAREQGSGDVPVLATPRLVALLEAAAVNALEGKLPDDMTSVGASLSIDHLAPSAVGAAVVASAVLEAIDDTALEFALQAMDGDTVIATGSHTRVIVERDQFLEKVTSDRSVAGVDTPMDESS